MHCMILFFWTVCRLCGRISAPFYLYWTEGCISQSLGDLSACGAKLHGMVFYGGDFASVYDCSDDLSQQFY